MAIRPIDEYPGNVDPADADYPNGKARDVSTPGAGDGTPLQADWLNDWYGFQAAVLDASGITPSGVPDTAQASQVLDAIKEVTKPARTWTYPESVGSPTAIGATAGIKNVVALSATRFVYTDSNAGEMRVYEWAGGAPTQVGNTLSIAIGLGRACLIAENRFVYADHQNDEIRVFSFDGTNIAQVGNTFVKTMGSGAAAAILSENTFALFNENDVAIQAHTFDGTDIAAVGNAFSLTAGAYDADMTTLKENRIVYIDENERNLVALDFDGTDFTTVGNAFDVGAVTNPRLANLDERSVVVQHQSPESMGVYTFDGTDFVKAGASIGSVRADSVTVLSDVGIVWDFNNTNLQPYRFNSFIGRGPAPQSLV